ncbi:MAG TPA: hypothetical protein VFA57_20625 [Pseudolabrys sp.]|nr:hypothetical protein [Pseudolabrys sp.]
MASRRKTRKGGKRAKPSRRGKRSDSEETINIIAGILVVILIGIGVYYYQTTTTTPVSAPAASTMSPAAQK